MKKHKFILFLILILMEPIFSASFKEQQLTFERVREAYAQKGKLLLERYQKQGFASWSSPIYLRAFKESSELELWAWSPKTKRWSLITTYHICKKSGVLGPKRAEGDEQVPEGFYHVSRFNPLSNYHLSLGINYPNRSDRVFANKQHPGGDVFIHGSCVTIGCLPLTDEFIKEVYIACVEAKACGQKEIPVHIFPYRMNDRNHKAQCAAHFKNPKLCAFWNNMKEGYDYFEQKKSVPNFTVDQQGRYRISNPT